MTKFTDLIKTNLMIAAALNGDNLDLENYGAYLVGNYEPEGVTPTLSTGNERLNTINTTINDRWAVANQNMADQISKLEEIRQVLITISGGEPSDIADELLGIAETVGNVAMILGAL